MVNCNPETVSTDYDTSDRLYFEPLTLEDVLGIVEVEQPEGVIVQFGGQTPLRLAAGLEAAGVPLLGTAAGGDRPGRGPRALRRAARPARAEGAGRTRPRTPRRRRWRSRRGSASRCSCARATCSAAARWRSSTRSTALEDYLLRVARGSHGREIFLDRFLENAVEVDVDAICDGEDVWIGGVMQHVEEAGIHSGDSACVLPPHSLGREMRDEIARVDARGSRSRSACVGLMNVQYAVLGDDLYVIEANPRASRTVPFVSKATGIPLAKMACRVMLGEKLADARPARRPARRPRRGQGGGDAVRPLRRLRLAARAGDALDRRGDGRGAATSRPRSPRRRRRRARGCRAPAPCSSP